MNDSEENDSNHNTSSKMLEDLRFILNNVLLKIEEKNNSLCKQIEKFEANIKYSLEQVDNKVSLSSIELPKDVSDEVLARDPIIIKKLDKIVDDWTSNIDKAMQTLTAPRQNIKTASMEIDNRRRVVSNLSILAQQLKSDTIDRILNIISMSEDTNNLKKQQFSNKVKQFESQYEDASDYLKFLVTLERSIKDLSSDDMVTIEHSISGIFHNLKIIYLISKHKDSTKFGFLMEVMAQEICDKISTKIKLDSIFKNPSESIKTLDQAIDIVKKWKHCYSETKNKAKWDFPNGQITGGTEYVQKICGKLKLGLEKVKEYLKFLGPELKRVIGGSTDRIEKEREKVHKAYSILENLKFPLFDKSYEVTYNEAFAKFEASMKELENDTVKLIDETFDGPLRSAESAYDLYINFGNLIKQEEIQQAMNKKYIKILDKFINEVTVTEEIFNSHKHSPSISKAKPIVSGKIAWARLLYLKMKKPISRIFMDNDKFDHSNNQEILKKIEELKYKFINIANKLKDYEREIFEEWKKECLEKFLTYMQNTILSTNGKKYEVNFDPKLKLMIRNTKFLNLYGFEAPKNINNLALEEVQKAKYCNSLNLMLREYDNLMNSLNDQHYDLLKIYIDKLNKEIDKGITSHNWTSFSIQGFIDDCLENIKQLSDKANSVFKSEEKIKSILKQIANSNLVRELDLTVNDNKELSNFYNYYDDHRKKVVSELINKYEDITNIILEIEKVTADSNFNDKNEYRQVQSKKKNQKIIENDNKFMSGYYNYWELCILNALTKTILKSVITLYEMFSMARHTNNQNILFTVKSKFVNSKEIMYNPNNIDINYLLKKLIHSFQYTGNEFIRWMDTTCKAPDYKDLTEEKIDLIVPRFTYGFEINENEDIKYYTGKFYHIFNKIDENLIDNKNKYVRVYTQNEKFGNWSVSKSNMERDLERNKILKMFEVKLCESLDYLGSFKKKFSIKKYCQGNCIINNEDLINKGVEQIKIVMDKMLLILVTHLEEVDMKELSDIIEENKTKLNEKVSDSDSLKNVLDNISKIHSKKLSMELRILEIEEKLHFLKLHNCNKLEELRAQFELLKKEWSNLRVKANKKDRLLKRNKEELQRDTENNVGIMKKDLEKIHSEYISNGPVSSGVSLESGYAKLEYYNKEIEKLKQQKANIVQCQKLFGIEIVPFFEIIEMSDTNAKIEPLYNFYHQFTTFYDEQLKKAWSKVDMNALSNMSQTFTDKIKSFKHKGLSGYSQFRELDKMKEDFCNNFEFVISQLKNPIIDERIMNSFMKEMKKNINVNFNGTSLKEILNLNLINDKEKISTLVDDARQENEIRNKVQDYEASLSKMQFRYKSFKKGNEDKGFIFVGVADEMADLQDYITNLQSLGNNKHAGAYKKEINILELEMNSIMELIEIWIEVQKKWMYLESIFVGSEDIRQKLPEETKEFDKYDKKFRALMVGVHKKNLIRFQNKEGNKRHELKSILMNFDIAEKRLTEHLDSKKNEFSRFYFLTEQDLLQILGSSDPLSTLNPHMIKLYQNCNELISDQRNIIGMKSEEGEILYFEKPIKVETQQQVGIWMNKVDDEMKSSLRQYTREGIISFAKEDLFKFIKTKLGMVTVLTYECWWTFALEDVFRKVGENDKYAMKRELERQTNLLHSLVVIVRRPDMGYTERLKINQLIIRTVHGRDIVDRFVRDSILDAREFEWESQLKFSWQKQEDDLKITQCNGTFVSCYEYQGINGRLVVTPLTDRCVMTITTAITFFLGSAPAGPAGTGKTETVKDLGKGMAIRVVVQNCTNTLDYMFMGQFFSGLSQTGFWGCFDEFNRINPEVLSVVTTQIKNIQTSLAQNKTSWILMAKEVNLLNTMSIFITMNPNYEGRSDLPDNLKALFRPITMVVPDQLIICENLLLSEGFVSSKQLAYKIDKLYQLCKEQLSKQHHYDWGLRTIKAVLSSAGILKRTYHDMEEDKILMRAMKDINMPKFIVDDSILFIGLIKDLFPTLNTEQEGNADIKKLVEEKMAALNYEVNEVQVEKVMQMFEIMNIRHTTMICGPPASGKSCILEVLKKTIEAYRKVNIIEYIINPKAQTIPRLYGIKNEISGDFEIGILANIFQVANQPLMGKEENRWVLLDGDIDPIWIENMNSVMDDSKCLTLENKDRILMQKFCSLVLESSNIGHASLATISRLGMVYLDVAIINVEHVFLRWLSKKNPKDCDWDKSVKEIFVECYKKVVPPLLKYVFKGIKGNEEEGTPLKFIVHQNDAPMINQLCNLIDSILPQKNLSPDINLIEQVFVFSCVWSIGACIIAEDRDKFSKTLNDIVQNSSAAQKIYDKMCVLNTGRYEFWDTITGIIEEESGEGKKYNEMIIPTMDTKRYSWLLQQMIRNNMPCMFIGESGTGKTITIQNYLSWISNPKSNTKTQYLILSTNFSSRTSALDFQTNMEEVLETRLMRTVGPPSGKNMIIFIDDLGMPNVDKYGTQQPLAFLKLLIEKRFYYTKDNKDKLSLIETNFLTSTLPPGGGNNQIDSRFVGLFNVFNVTAEQEAVTKIFEVILSNFLKPGVGFEDEELTEPEFTNQLVKATTEVYNIVKSKLKRTPIKFHYTFNIRDISKIFQGFCQITPQAINNKDKAVKLWKHETLRVIGDKLVSHDDKNILFKIIETQISKYFNDHLEFAMNPICIFGDFMKCNFISEDDDDDVPEDAQKKEVKEIRYYENIEAYDDAKKVIETALNVYNEDKNNQVMNLVMYTDAIDHLLIIHRILRIERGNPLLIGVGGSGKQSLVRLATFIAKYELWGIKITANFNEKAFREQLIELFLKFSKLEEMTPITFLFTDEQILDEGFMELINNILTTGIVPAIFDSQTKTNIINDWGSRARDLDIPQSKDNCFNLFVQNIRDNLHVAMAMSPSGSKLRLRCRNFPGLVANTTIDWFFEWPEEALLSVSSYLMRDMNLEENLKEIVYKHMIYVHLSVTRQYSKEAEALLKRHIYLTPKNFLDYIFNIKKMFDSHIKNNNQQIDRLEKGLEVISSASEKIEKLSQTVKVQKEEADITLVELEKVKSELEESKKIVQEKQENAKIKEGKLIIKSKEVKEEKESLHISLIENAKLVEDIKEKAKKIDKKNYDMLSTTNNYETAIGCILKCIYFIQVKTSTKWGDLAGAEVQSYISKSNTVFVGLTNVEATVEKISYKQLDEAYKRAKESNFNEVTNIAAAQLKGWILKFYDFAYKTKIMKENQQDLQAKEEELINLENDLKDTKDKLIELEVKMNELVASLEEKNAAFTKIDANVRKLKITLDAATDLFSDLKGEQTRWSELKVELIAGKEYLVGEVLLGSSFLSYVGPFSFEFRKRMIYNDWKEDLNSRGINVKNNFDIKYLLTTELKISEWNIEGLPDDDLSIQNGILTEEASRFPLCIDPEMQAIKWIRGKDTKPKIISFNTPDYMKYVLLALDNGETILIENVQDNLDPGINSVLDKNLKKSMGRTIIVVDGKQYDYKPSFKIIMTTKLSNPHYSPEIMAKTTVINYSVTMDGLEDQLLNDVIRNEFSSLETTRKNLVQEMNKQKITLKTCEARLLEDLSDSESQGDILDNQKLILSLKETKSTAKEVTLSLKISQTTKEDIDQSRSNYKSVAKRGSILYFAMSALRLINSMYEYSLSTFQTLFKKSMLEAKQDKIIANRLDHIKKKLTANVFEYTCLSIFEKHRLMFTFHMKTMMMKYEENLDPIEMDFFLRGNPSLAEPKRNKEVDWMSSVGWKDLDKLVTLSPVFSNLMNDIVGNQELFRTWYDLEKPENTPIPLDYENKLSLLQKLLVLRIFRPDRIYNGIKNFIKSTMSEFYVNFPSINMDKIFDQSSENIPILFILSPGVDPMSFVSSLAIKKGFYEKKFRYMSLGQKQEKEAKELIIDGAKRGLWVMLQNCDLLKDWLKELENIIENIHNPKPDFRIWLTTSPIDEFPIGLLQKSFKVVTEPPDGLNLNMVRVFSSLSDDQLEKDCIHYAYKPLLFTLCFFHAVLQDRKKFGKIGWNIVYDFSESDFTISQRLLATYLGKLSVHDQIPWSSLKYLIGEAMYGGRVTDDFDRRMMMTYLNEYMGDFIFDKNQKFFFSKEGFDYDIPEDGPYDMYMKLLSELPSIYSPEVIGLHSNAEIDYFTQASKLIWNNLITLQSTGGASAGGKTVNKDTFVTEISDSLITLLSKNFEKFDIAKIKKGFVNKSPIDSVLIQELEGFNLLTNKMITTLLELKQALTGEISFNQDIEALSNSLFMGKIPDNWKKLAPETQKNLGNWIEHLKARYKQYKEWSTKGEPKVMWISGLAVPASYLKAIIQSTSRKKGWALDKVDTYTIVTKYYDESEITQKPEYGCFISGLFLEGAEWSIENNSLIKQTPKKLLCQMPLLQVIPAEAAKIKLRNNFRTPVYMTQNRVNIQGQGLVFIADLRTIDHPNNWILQGVCMVLNIS